jgi:hypothetical protein
LGLFKEDFNMKRRIGNALRYVDEHSAKIVCFVILGVPILFAIVYLYLGTL